jgi:dihydroneopterin aldolase
MNDILYINDLTLSCILGVFEQERKTKQNVMISIELHLDLRKPGKTDDINDTVSYHDIAAAVTKMVEKSQYFLLEALAEAIAEICLADRRVKLVNVYIEKPKALTQAKSSGITIQRKNE